MTIIDTRWTGSGSVETNIDPAVYKVIGEIYEELERYEPWTDDARAVADIGILTLAGGELADCHYGAVRMLGELKMTYDIINEGHDLSAYKVIILPDDVRITAVLGQKLKLFIAAGGGVISSGHSGLNPEGTAFALDDWNMSYEGEDSWNSSYFRMLEDTEGEMPDMLCGIYSQGIWLQAKEGAQEIAEYWQPYFNREWDGFHGSFYTPPDRYAGRPAVARSGNIIQLCFPVFGAYMEYAANVHKQLVGYCLKQLLPQPLVKCEGIPTTARVTETAKENKQMVHVKLTHPEPRGKYNVIEDVQTLNDGVVLLKANSIKAVYKAPGKEPLAYEQMDDYIRIPLPKVEGYILVVVESFSI